MCLKFENLRNIDWKSYFWEIWVQYKCFWKAFHLILIHSIHKILCFEEFLHKIDLFFKNLIFPNFWLIKSVSRPIKITIKILVWIYLVWLLLDQSNVIFDRSNLISIIRKSFKEFFKNINISRVCHYSNIFKKFSLSLSSIDQGSKQNFLSFSLKFLQGFFTSKAGKTFLPLLFHLFSCFMHFGKISNLRKIGVFVDFNLFFQNWSLGFCYRMLLNCSLVFNLINLLI